MSVSVDCATPRHQENGGAKKRDKHIPLKDTPQHAHRISMRPLVTARQHQYIADQQQTLQQTTNETKMGGIHNTPTHISLGTSLGQFQRINDRRAGSGHVVQITNHLSDYTVQRRIVFSTKFNLENRERNSLQNAYLSDEEVAERSHLTDKLSAFDSAYYSSDTSRTRGHDLDFPRKVTPPHIALGKGIQDSCQRFVFH